ncbi:MAG: CRISPR-associated endonuclease Cas2 [Rhizobium sp.]
MARPDHLYVFTYDVSRNQVRSRLADMLLEHMTRVQGSVYEGRMTREKADRLAGRAAGLLGPDDSLRVYCLTEAGRQASFHHGGPPLGEAADFWLL